MNAQAFVRYALIAAATGMLFGEPRAAYACGGLFCSSPNQPVNQAAERIIFSANGDGTVTAVIQIMYQGTAQNFSWLLPISTVPTGKQIDVASNLAFQRLQNATNPQYSLTVRVEGVCSSVNVGGFPTAGSAGASSMAGPGPANGTPGVTVAASGTTGPFDWTVISIEASLADPADAALDWLTKNNYSVGEGARGLIRPYLQDGLHLLALKLVKGSDVGSIRPLMLTYDAKSPMIPIKLTAVAANNDMGVMTWLLSNARGVPQNYLSLELNEARINWFNANSNYNAVVTAAADEAGGQGFVTEYARPAKNLAKTVWTDLEEMQWQTFRTATFSSFQDLFDRASNQWRSWDGFWDAVRAAITLPEGVNFEDFQACPNCYPGIQLTPSVFLAALESNVIEPMRAVQALIDRNGYVTRLYSTMSAAEMTADPLFTFNDSLAEVSNVHTATRVIECSPSLTQFAAPWRIELPSGDVLRGTGSQFNWPAFADQPSNSRIVRVSASGPGAVLEDNSQTISDSLETYNAQLSQGSGGTPSSTGGSPSGGSAAITGGSPAGGSPALGGSPAGGSSSGSSSTGGSTTGGSTTGGSPASASSHGCSTSGGAPASGWAFTLALAAFGWLKRRRY